MSDFDRNYARTVPADRADMSVDAGLRSFMLGVYNKVALGLVLSGALAWVTAFYAPVRDMLFRIVETPQGLALTGYTPLGWVVAFAPLGVMLFGMGMLKNPTAKSASVVYWLIVSLIGASLGTVFLRYNLGSVATTFAATSIAFGALSLFGYTTKKDLTGMGSFLLVGLVGIIIASVVNIFLASPMLHFAVSVLGVLIFAGLIAFDTQRLKLMYYQIGEDANARGVATSFGALSLYLNFINLFQFLLSIFGSRE